MQLKELAILVRITDYSKWIFLSIWSYISLVVYEHESSYLVLLPCGTQRQFKTLYTCKCLLLASMPLKRYKCLCTSDLKIGMKMLMSAPEAHAETRALVWALECFLYFIKIRFWQQTACTIHGKISSKKLWNYLCEEHTGTKPQCSCASQEDIYWGLAVPPRAPFFLYWHCGLAAK